MANTFTTIAKRSILLAAILTSLLGHAQDEDMMALRSKRWRMIDKYHFSSSMGIEHNVNTVLSPRLSLGIGSFRNLFNADAGVAYEMVNPLYKRGSESIGLHRVAPFLSAQCNVVRWWTGSVYVGGEVAYLLNVRTRHRLPDGLSLNDPDIAQSHFTVSAKCGLRINYWDFCLYYCYDLSSAWGQKHIYETVGYDFYYLEPSIYERRRMGIRVTYHLTIRPQ